MIWCVEDEDSIREIEVYTLASTGFEARGFEDSASFFEALEHEIPDLLILDIMLPDEDGIEVLKKIRAHEKTRALPIIMATAKGMEYDKIKGLDLGADDYLVKPFGMMEMVSRVKAVLRRCQPREKETTLKYEELEVNLEERTVYLDEERMDITLKEFEMLCLFMRNPGRVFTRDSLLNTIWGIDYDGETRTVDVHIRTLRKKLGRYGDLITTVRGVGYRMETVE